MSPLKTVVLKLIGDKYNGMILIYPDGSVSSSKDSSDNGYFAPDIGEGFSVPSCSESSFNEALLAFDTTFNGQGFYILRRADQSLKKNIIKYFYRVTF